MSAAFTDHIMNTNRIRICSGYATPLSNAFLSVASLSSFEKIKSYFLQKMHKDKQLLRELISSFEQGKYNVIVASRNFELRSTKAFLLNPTEFINSSLALGSFCCLGKKQSCIKLKSRAKTKLTSSNFWRS